MLEINSSARKALFFTFTITLLSWTIFAPLASAESFTSFTLPEIRAEQLIADKEFDATTLLVKYKDDAVKPQSFNQSSLMNDWTVVRTSSRGTTQQPLVTATRRIARSFKEKERIKNRLVELLQDPTVEYAQPNYVYHLAEWGVSEDQAKPSDYKDLNHWYYSQAGLPEMWKSQSCPSGGLCGGKGDVIVAVLDSGLAFEDYYDGYLDETFYKSPEVDANGLYFNPGEIQNNGRDDDCNGVVDDVHGFDAYQYSMSSSYEQETCSSGYAWYYASSERMLQTGHPNDSNGHGTFVSGLISGVVDNGYSVSPDFNVKLMPITVRSPYTGDIYSDSIAYGVYYAVNNGADVINMSFGGSAYDQIEKDALDYASQNDVALVAASGNENQSQISYPARYSNVIAVGSANPIGSANVRSNYSNYGSNLDLLAYVGEKYEVGESTYQTSLSCFFSEDCLIGYDDFSAFEASYSVGTSYAAPQVSAAVAILKSVFPTLTPSEVQNIIVGTTVDVGPVGWDRYTGSGILNWENLWNAPPLRNGSSWRRDAGNEGDEFHVGDFNGDGKDDIAIVRNINSTTMKWWVVKSTGRSFSAPRVWRSDAGNEGDEFHVGDFNGDGQVDLFIRRQLTNNTVRWYRLISTGEQFGTVRNWQEDFSSSNLDNSFISDFTGDKLVEIATVRNVDLETQSWFMSYTQ